MNTVELYQSEFYKISFLPDHQVLLAQSFNNAYMPSEIYQEDIMRLPAFAQAHQAKGVIFDMRQSKFTITPDLQVWTAEVVQPKFREVGIKRSAILMSEDFISQLSIEQVLDEGKDSFQTTRFFAKEAEAIQWLLAA